MIHRIGKKELIQAQAALFVAIALQLFSRHIGGEQLPGSQYIIILTEVTLAVLLGFTANMHQARTKGIHHAFAVALLALISVANISGLIFVLHSLIIDHAISGGEQLLVSAIAIFMTNIIVYALWYWEIDSPGLTRTRWSKHDKDFQFTQQDMTDEFPGWRPEFSDYLYVSITNAVNFAPADTRPLTRQVKLLMASQALISVFTLALVIARSVSILGT
ncbi:MAG: putative rane protein [Candidatus Saccharibacteria bacterium]|nr:putative rane protein [Candidatus Saccharibacteria bacterium]